MVPCQNLYAVCFFESDTKNVKFKIEVPNINNIEDRITNANFHVRNNEVYVYLSTSVKEYVFHVSGDDFDVQTTIYDDPDGTNYSPTFKSSFMEFDNNIFLLKHNILCDTEIEIKYLDIESSNVINEKELEFKNYIEYNNTELTLIPNSEK